MKFKFTVAFLSIASIANAALHPDMAHMPDFMNDAKHPAHMVTGVETAPADEYTIVVMPGGVLNINSPLSIVNLVMMGGTVNCASDAWITIKDVPFDLAFDPEQFGHGIIGMEGAFNCVGRVKITWQWLSLEGLAGNTTLQLKDAATGWNPGDELILGDSRARSINELKWDEPGIPDGTALPRVLHDDTEYVTIQSISADGKLITLTKPLQYNHTGARLSNGQLVFNSAVGNMTRSGGIKSENANGIRGHILLSDRLRARVEYMAIVDMGRTCAEQLDNTVWSESTPIHIGNCQIGRYSLHAHHLIGELTTTFPSGFQFQFIGNAIVRGRKFCIAIHDSSYGLIQNNVTDCIGTGIITETGQEIGNLIDHNLNAHTPGSNFTHEPEATAGSIGTQGVGLWGSGFGNFVTNNVSIGARAAGFKMLSGVTGGNVNTRCPSFQGADPRSSDGYDCTADSVPFGSFNANTCIGGANKCFIFYSPETRPRMVINDIVVWNATREGFVQPLASELTINKFTCIGGSSYIESCLPFPASRNLTVTDVLIDNALYGITVSQLGYAEMGPSVGMNIEHGTVSAVHPVGHSRDLHNFTPPEQPNETTVLIKDLKLNSLPGGNWGQASDLITHIAGIDDGLDSTKSIRFLAYGISLNGAVVRDFEVFTAEQVPDAPMPKTGSWTHPITGRAFTGLYGCSVDGLTVQQCFNQFGVTMNHRVAPCSTVVSGVTGFVCPITDPPIPTPVITSITVTGQNTYTAVGQSAQLTATARLSNNTNSDVTSIALWASSSTSIATVASGLVTARAPGNASISATAQNITGSLGVSVIAPGPGTSVTFLKTDATTQGSWKNVYGKVGAVIPADGITLPSYVNFTLLSGTPVFYGYGNDTRFVQSLSSAQRALSFWRTNTDINLALNFTDDKAHQVALYGYEGGCISDGSTNTVSVNVLDAMTSAVLDTRTLYLSGQYLVWVIKGSVNIQVSNGRCGTAVNAFFID